MTKPMRAVFLSYASQDVEAARRICDSLRVCGIEVWFDQSELKGGDFWDQHIRKQIRECALFIPIISATTQARAEGYFRREWKLAVDRTSDMSERAAFLVPIVIDRTVEADADVPNAFRTVQWTRLYGGDTPHLFTERVAHLLSLNGATVPPMLAARTPTQSKVLAPVAINEKSVAVLPFSNLSADKDNEYFSDGLAEEILNALSRIEDLKVASRGSAFSFRGKTADIGEIAAKLNVANVLEGSVRRAGNRIRITVQLVDARNGFHLWSERYDRQLEDIFEIQDEIAGAIADRLKVTLDGGAARSIVNFDAYELYLKGRHFWHQRSPATVQTAIQYFKQAIELDSQYALAFAGLGDCYCVLRFYGFMRSDSLQPLAHSAVMRAVTLAPNLWESNFSHAMYILAFERAWREAEPYFKKAIAINSRSPLANVYYGIFLTTAGRPEPAVAQVILACELDPLAPIIHSLAAIVFSSLGQFDAAERAARHALSLQPEALTSIFSLVGALNGLGRFEDGIKNVDQALGMSRATIIVGAAAGVYAQAGRPDEATRLLRELDDRAARGEFVAVQSLLMPYIALGDRPKIRAQLSRALVEGTLAATIRLTCGHWIQAYRTDLEIDRLHREIFGW